MFEKFENKIIDNNPFPGYGGLRKVFRFENGYGAVLLNNRATHGTELSVCKFESADNDSFVTDYSTHLTRHLADGVFIWLEEEEVEPLLQQISEL